MLFENSIFPNWIALDQALTSFSHRVSSTSLAYACVYLILSKSEYERVS